MYITPCREQIAAELHRPPFNEVSVLFPLLTLCTVAYLAMVTAEFFLRSSDLLVPSLMLPLYVTLLGAYAADKEIRRWIGAPEPQRKGAIFVYFWVMLSVAMIIIRFFRSEYVLPPDLGKVVLQVVGIFFGSRASKVVYDRRQGRPALDAADAEPDVPGDSAEISIRQTRLMEQLQAKGSLTRAETIALLGISPGAASRLLAEMQGKGLIRLVGEGRGAHYVAVQKDAQSQ